MLADGVVDEVVRGVLLEDPVQAALSNGIQPAGCDQSDGIHDGALGEPPEIADFKIGDGLVFAGSGFDPVSDVSVELPAWGMDIELEGATRSEPGKRQRRDDEGPLSTEPQGSVALTFESADEVADLSKPGPEKQGVRQIEAREIPVAEGAGQDPLVDDGKEKARPDEEEPDALRANGPPEPQEKERDEEQGEAGLIGRQAGQIVEASREEEFPDPGLAHGHLGFQGGREELAEDQIRVEEPREEEGAHDGALQYGDSAVLEEADSIDKSNKESRIHATQDGQAKDKGGAARST